MAAHAAHVVAIFGGGIAGSEAAHRLAERGIYSVVFEMEALPWGKIELGLPKWHVKQRNKEEDGIDEHLCNPYVNYVPLTKLGRDIDFQDVRRWGFSAILLAVGAWKDRPLGIPGIEEYEGKGFYYQNPFVAWFNQYHAPEYQGPRMEICDDAVVVGGGLASLDVVKILMLETTLRELRKRGLRADLFEMEKKGIPRVLEELSLDWKDLSIKGCTLFYRRTASEMPLVPIEDDAPGEKLAKARLVRQKLLDNFRAKYLFHFQPLRVATDKAVEGDRLVGLVFRETELVEGRVRVVSGTEHEVRTPLVISSIGSVPEPISGLGVEGELLRVEDPKTGKLADYDDVFALGNAVTGRGYIQASRVHGRQVSDLLMDDFLQWSAEDFETLRQQLASLAGEVTEAVAADCLSRKTLKSRQEIEAVLDRARRRQRQVGYDGDYLRWVEAHRQTRLESM